MSQIVTDGSERQLLPRTVRSARYHLYLVATMVAATILLLFVPYVYDQYNYEMYEQALGEKNLVIQEFRSAYEAWALDKCKSIECPMDFLTQEFRHKKLIALDYVSEMENTGRLGLAHFIGSTIGAIIAVGFFITLTTLFVNSPRARTGCIIAAVVIAIVGIQFFYLVGTIPHTNIKFEFLFGVLIALVVSVSDYLHHVHIGVGNVTGAESKYVSIALQETHKKWTSILGYSLTLIMLIVGTVSFSAISYFRIVFGDSFLIAPSAGVGFAIAALLLIFGIGVVGNIRKILIDIESKIAALKDT
jgi:uncharacterized membrane protein